MHAPGRADDAVDRAGRDAQRAADAPLLVDHGQGAVSAYFHLDTALVAKGDMVRAGQRVGRVGATGLATGPHVHFTMYLHGKDVDPGAWRDMPDWLLSTRTSTTDTTREGR